LDFSAALQFLKIAQGVLLFVLAAFASVRTGHGFWEHVFGRLLPGALRGVLLGCIGRDSPAMHTAEIEECMRTMPSRLSGLAASCWFLKRSGHRS